jgi:O-antigen/teichoic acid export membrane protein
LASTLRNVLANYFGQFWAVFVGFAFVPLYVRVLGAEGYGVVGFFLVAQAWLPLLDLGMLPAVNREFARFNAGALDRKGIRDLLRSIEILCLVPAFAIALLIVLTSDRIAQEWLNISTLSASSVALALDMMAIVIALRLFEGIYRGALLGARQQTEYNAAIVVLATVRHGGAVGVLLLISPTIEAFFIWQAIVSIVTVLVLGALTYRFLGPSETAGKFSRAAIASVWKFASASALTTMLGIALSQTDKVLLSKLLPLASFGVFALAITACSLLPMLLNPICTAVYPRLVECATQENSRELSRIYHQSSQLLATLVMPVALTLAFFSVDIMKAWTGSAEIADAAGPILSWYILGGTFSAMVQLPAYLQLAYGWTSLAAWLNMIAVAVLVPLLLVAVPRFGVMAAAGIWALLNLAYLIFMVGIMHRRLLPGQQWRWYGRSVLLPGLAAAAVVGGGWWLVHDAVREWGRPGMFVVAAVLVAGVAGAAAVTDIGQLGWRQARALTQGLRKVGPR